MKGKPAAVPLFIAALAILTGCAGSTSAVGASPLPNATYSGPIVAPATVAAGVILQVPAVQPQISWQQAYDACKSGDGTCDQQAAAVISLALATSPNAGEISSTDSSIKPLMHGTLVYVITQVGVPCAPTWMPAGPSTKPITVPVYTCTFVNFVDAATSKVLYSTNGPASSG